MTNPKTNKEPERADESTPAKVSAARVKGARFLGGAWLAPDGSPLTGAEAQQAHRAMDRAAAAAREKALGGRE